MDNLVLPQQDFFMYIPELQKVKGHPGSIRRDSAVASIQCGVVPPAAHGDWVKIALDGPVTVYAHVWDMEDEEIAG
jgi:hypothetical protein